MAVHFRRFRSVHGSLNTLLPALHQKNVPPGPRPRHRNRCCENAARFFHQTSFLSPHYWNPGSISQVVNLATNLINEIGNRYIHTALDCYVDEFISTLGNSIAQSAISTSNKFIKEVLKDFPTSSSFVSDEDCVTVDEAVIKEYELPETIAIPIGHNRVKIKFDTLIAIIGVIISLFALFKPSASEQEQLALQRTEVQILSEILESTKASNATTSEQLDTLKESVDTIQKEIAESKNNESENQ